MLKLSECNHSLPNETMKIRYREDVVSDENITGWRCQTCGLSVIKSFNEEYTKEDMLEETA